MTNKVTFTQYLRPNASRRPAQFVVNDEVMEQATKLKEAGCVFNCEVLRTREVALYVEEGEDLVCMQVSENNPRALSDALTRLFADAVEKKGIT